MKFSFPKAHKYLTKKNPITPITRSHTFLSVVYRVWPHEVSVTQVQATSTGRITAIPFWYHIYLDRDISVSTLSQNSHWRQAAVVLQQPLQVRAGDWVHLAVKIHKSTISISARVEASSGQMEQ